MQTSFMSVSFNLIDHTLLEAEVEFEWEWWDESFFSILKCYWINMIKYTN